jgi:hypothetical protein
MMTNQEIMKALLTPKEGKHLGDLCGWSLRGMHKSDDVHALCDELGLADDFKFPRVTPVNAYRRAVVDACKDAARNDERGWSAHLVQNDESCTVHELVRVQITGGSDSTLTDNRADFSAETRVRFDKVGYAAGRNPEQLMLLEHPDHPIAKEAARIYLEHMHMMRTADIRSGFQRAFEKWNGIRVLDHGGLWLVPAPFAEKVRAWKTFLDRLNCTAMIIPTLDTQETVDSMQRMANDSLEAQFAKILDELQQFATKDNTRVSTLESRLEAFGDLRSKTELYERLLGMKLDQLKTRLGAAADSLKTSLASLPAG